MPDMRSLPGHLREWRDEIRQNASERGLDFFEVIYEMVDYDEMNMIAAFDGFPTRYPHWRFGMRFEELQKSYSYGMSKIYELVINNDPCYAYLMRNNPLVDQKLVMSHVYGHSDFFKNNAWFEITPPVVTVGEVKQIYVPLLWREVLLDGLAGQLVGRGYLGAATLAHVEEGVRPDHP